MEMQNSKLEPVRISGIGMYSDMLGLSDAKLKADDGRTFDVHKAILAINSDYFRTMFCSPDRYDRTEFTVPGISGECLSNALWYVYTGSVRVTEENVRDLLIVADYLLLEDLQMEIKECIKASMTELNCLTFLEAAYQTDYEDILRECFRFIQTRFEGIVRCQKKELAGMTCHITQQLVCNWLNWPVLLLYKLVCNWLNWPVLLLRFEGIVRCQKTELADLPLEILKTILSNRSLYVYSETTVWQTIVEWTQKDTPSRICCVPQLLLTLALEDIGEDLATEILQHEIISKNSLMKDLIEMRSSKNFTSNIDVLISYLRSYTNRFTEQSQPCKPSQPHSHRIPHNLYVFMPTFRRKPGERINKMYITYDENPDLWRKISDLDIYPKYLIAVGHNIYILDFFAINKTCINFDLSSMDWKPIDCFTNEYTSYCSVLAIEAYIYILGNIWNLLDFDSGHTDTYAVEIYDTENCRWFDGVSLHGIYYGASVAFEQKIYFVGYTMSDGMTTQVFDPVTQQWSLLSPPKVNRSYFALVAYHQKLYLVGGSARNTDDLDYSNAEVFDPATNLWEELPDLPHTFKRTKAQVFCDQIVVYDSEYFEGHKKNTVLWNNVKECWEVSDKTTNNIRRWMICSVDDVDAIRMITKQNRDPNTHMDKIFFT